MNYFKHFGGKVTKALISEYEISDNWQSGRFQNLVQTKMDMNLRHVPSLIKKQFFENNGKRPQQDLPIHIFNNSLWQNINEPCFIWYWHSVVLLKLNNLNLLIDPMFGDDAAPIAPFKSKRFSQNALAVIDQLPEIDLLLLTHDHYDHLDLRSMLKLKSKTKRVFTSLGVKRHLLSWGFNPDIISEFDWWDEKNFNEISITFTPTRHFSGRGISDRQKSLWGGWVFKTSEHRIYFSGDGGYANHFKEVGKRLGPFDIAFIECGQYNELWHAIHLFPEESIQASLEANANLVIPVHWGAFSLALHHWHEPANRFAEAAIKSNVNFNTPELGLIFTLKNNTPNYWWQHYN